MKKIISSSLCVLCASAVQFSRAYADGPDLAEVPAYRAALSASPDPSAPLVSFRDLWDRPGSHQGRAVRVEGKVARRFRQDRVGEFPPLVEVWVVSPAGEPTCLVFPEAGDRETIAIGGRVRFSGTFLRKIRYRGGDSERIAPLIVGPSAPEPISTGRFPGDGPTPWSGGDWLVGLGAAAAVVVMLASRHLYRPAPSRASRRPDPPPSFVDGDPTPEPGEDGHEGS